MLRYSVKAFRLLDGIFSPVFLSVVQGASWFSFVHLGITKSDTTFVSTQPFGLHSIPDDVSASSSTVLSNTAF